MARRPPAHGVILVNEAGDEYSLGGTGTSSAQTQGTAAAGAVATGSPVQVGGVVNTSNGPTAEVTGDAMPIWVTASGAPVMGAAALTAAVGQSNVLMGAVVLPSGSRGFLGIYNYDYNGSTWDPVRRPNATSRIPSAAASTNATSAKASAGDLHCISGYNAAVAVRYLKFYAKATAPTVGTDVPVITLALPASSAFNINLNGHYIATGIAYAMTTGAADNDTGALTAGDVLGLTVTYA